MEVTARLRYLRGSAQKVRLVADLIRGKGVQEAVHLLEVTNKAAAPHVQKCLKSAIANAENRDDHVDVDRLFVKEIFVDGGPSMIFDYQNTSIVWMHYRDEVREVSPGVFLGIMHWVGWGGPTIATWFALDLVNGQSGCKGK